MKSALFEIEASAVKAVVKHFDTTEENLLEDVRNLKTWVLSQPHLPNILDEQSIRNFFILSRCSVEKTKRKLDLYCTIRSLIPEIYERINPKLNNMKEVRDLVYCSTLPKLTEEMYRVWFFKIRNHSMIEKIDLLDVIGHVINLEELRLREDCMIGDVVVFDAERVTLSFLIKLTPAIFSKIVTIFGKVFSAPVKSVYIVNSPSFIATLMAVLKTALKPQIFEKIHVYEDSKILEEDLSEKILPRDYGGNEKSLEELQELVKLKFLQSQGLFDQLDALKVDETLRPKQLKSDAIFGFHGNFKKLNID